MRNQGGLESVADAESFAVGFGQNADAGNMSRSTTHGERRNLVQFVLRSYGGGELRWKAAVAAPAEVVVAAHTNVATAVLG